MRVYTIVLIQRVLFLKICYSINNLSCIEEQCIYDNKTYECNCGGYCGDKSYGTGMVIGQIIIIINAFMVFIMGCFLIYYSCCKRCVRYVYTE